MPFCNGGLICGNGCDNSCNRCDAMRFGTDKTQITPTVINHTFLRADALSTVSGKRIPIRTSSGEEVEITNKTVYLGSRNAIVYYCFQCQVPSNVDYVVVKAKVNGETVSRFRCIRNERGLCSQVSGMFSAESNSRICFTAVSDNCKSIENINMEILLNYFD